MISQMRQSTSNRNYTEEPMQFISSFEPFLQLYRASFRFTTFCIALPFQISLYPLCKMRDPFLQCCSFYTALFHCFTAFPLNKYATSTSPHCSSHPTSRSTQYSIRLCFIISLHTHCTNLSLLHHRIVPHLLPDILHGIVSDSAASPM